MAAGHALAADWPDGSSVLISSGEEVTVSSVIAPLSCFTNNGTLTFLPGASMTLTGGVVTAVASGTGETGVFDMQGGSLTNQGAGHFIVGHLGGSGTMTIASGATFRTPTGYFGIARNETDRRDRPSFGEVTVAGTLIADTRVEFTGFFQTGLEPPYALAARLTLADGGVIETPQITKNDCAASEFIFQGGTLRAGLNNAGFIAGNGVMDIIITDNTDAIFDTNGKNISIFPLAEPNDTVLTLRGENGSSALGNGGLVKTGAGVLAFRLSAACNTFTGAVTVVEGTLDLGRPLAEHQTVTVHAGASFVPYSSTDIPKITYLGDEGDLLTYVVTRNTDGLDLVALNHLFYDDRFAGPFGGDPAYTLSNTVVHAAGTLDDPFRLIGQVGTLNLTNTGLESAFIQVEGPGTFNFLGSRTYTSADAGKIAVTDGGYKQATNFTVADPMEATPAALALSSGRFMVGNALNVGLEGFGQFAADGVAITANNIKVGGAAGSQGMFIQSAGTVTANAESYIGADSGNGTLVVTGGQFIVNNNLRVASNPLDKQVTATQGSVTLSNALLRCNDFYFTSWWPTDGSAKTTEAGLLHLLPGGMAEINSVIKNDDPISTIRFGGGTLRARQNHGTFINAGQANGTLNLTGDEDAFITIDSQSYVVAITTHPGTITFTGAGGLKKLGAGTLFYAPDHADYAGDTVVEEGTLRLFRNELIPHGAGMGNVRLANNAVLDISGRTETINSVSGEGFVRSANAPAILGVLADGSDFRWERGWLDGAITLDKLGAGTLTVDIAKAVPANLVVSDGTVRLANSEGYLYYRFKVEGVKTPASANSMQFSEIALYNNGVNVTTNRSGILYDSTGGTGSAPESSAFPGGERPENAVDGLTTNKWLDFRIKDSRTAEDKERVWLRIDFPEAQPITSYNWATGNDSEARDPAAWRLQGSQNGNDWVDLDVQTGFNATGARNTWVRSDDGFPVSSVNTDIVSDAGWVTVTKGTTLELDSMEETIGALNGDGTVALNNAALTIATSANTETIFSGTLTGQGDLVKTGAGTQVLFGTNDYSGATVVQEGTLRVQGLEPCKWFRFTIMKNRSNVNVTQFSEFALYGADGLRQNLNLTLGSSVSALAPGEFASPAVYSTGSANETPDKLFDDNTGTKWCPNANTPTPGNSGTYRTVVMRLPDSTPEITAYNLCTANDHVDRDPVTWTLEASVDGVTWIEIDARTDVNSPNIGGVMTGGYANTGRFLYYNDGTPYSLSRRAVNAAGTDSRSDVIPAGSVVDVRAGATLDIQAVETIGALRVDMQDTGTITKLIAEPNGTLHIVNAGGQTSGLVLPLTVGSIENRSNLASWKVYIDGVLQGDAVLSVDADGRLFLTAKGTVLFLK